MHRSDGSELKIAEHHFAEIEIHKEKRQKGDFFIVPKRLNASTLRIRREKSRKVEKSREWNSGKRHRPSFHRTKGNKIARSIHI